MIYLLLLCVFVLILVDGWAIYQMHKRAAFGQLIKVDSLQSLSVTEKYNGIDAFKKRIAGEPWVHSEKVEEQCLGALQWTMNRVSTVGVNSTKNPLSLLNSVESGQGAVCSEMALLYCGVLSALGILSRKIYLYRNIFDEYDLHATVEVFLNGKWVIMDPTFNVSFSDSQGQFLSAQEIKEYFLSGRHNDIKVTFYGEVAYPPRLGNYYMDILPCFNNVFVVNDGKSNPLLHIPPLCYWFGTKMYYEELPKESAAHLKFWKQFYFITTVILPILILSIAFMAIGAIFMRG